MGELLLRDKEGCMNRLAPRIRLRKIFAIRKVLMGSLIGWLSLVKGVSF